MSSTEGLQIAQIIADLQALQNADHQAALSLLAPLKPSPTTSTSDGTTTPNASFRRTSSTPKFDKLGRRIVTVPRSRSNTATRPPAFTRGGSSFSMNSGTSTPMRGMSYSNEATTESGDEDLTRARTLLQLFEMRGKFRQMGDTGLSRAKERVDEVVAKYAQEDLDERERVAKARHLGV